MVGAFVTAVYSFRMVFLTFFGEAKTHVTQQPGFLVTVPLAVLAFCSIFAGFIEVPHNFGHVQMVSGFLKGVLPEALTESRPGMELALQMVSGLVCLAGALVAYMLSCGTRSGCGHWRALPKARWCTDSCCRASDSTGFRSAYSAAFRLDCPGQPR